MARKSIEERLAQLEAQRKTLQARLTKDERARDIWVNNDRFRPKLLSADERTQLKQEMAPKPPKFSDMPPEAIA